MNQVPRSPHQPECKAQTISNPAPTDRQAGEVNHGASVDGYRSSQKSVALPAANADISIILEPERNAVADEDDPRPTERPAPIQILPTALPSFMRDEPFTRPMEDHHPVQRPAAKQVSFTNLSTASKLKHFIKDQRLIQKKLTTKITKKKKNAPISAADAAISYIREAGRQATAGKEDLPFAQSPLALAALPIELDDALVLLAPRKTTAVRSELTTPVVDRVSIPRGLSGIEGETAAMVIKILKFPTG